jgi:myotubularin-related protein 6/7/8
MDRCGLFGAANAGGSEPGSGGESRETSPIFLQFLEAVWQLIGQFPTSFQFNERFLLCLHDHAHAPQFGTFVGNCEKDRVDLR